MAVLSPTPKFQAFDNNGVFLVGGKLFTYEAGTTTNKTSYTDSTEATPNTNPIILDSRGEANVWLSSGSYKLVLKDSLDNTIWTVDNIAGNSGSFQKASTIADLKAISGVEGSIITVLGYYSENDGGGGTFYWDSTSSAADDGGVVIQDDTTPATGRWIRLIQGAELTARQYGALGDGTTDDYTKLNNLITYVNTAGNELNIVLDNGNFRTASSLTFPAGTNLIFKGDGKLTKSSGATVLINSSLDDDYFDIFAQDGGGLVTSLGFGDLVCDHIYVNWFGATGDGATNDYLPIASAVRAADRDGLRSVKFKPGIYVTGSSILLETDDIELIGSGPSSTTIKTLSGSVEPIEGSGGSRIRISDLKVTSDSPSSGTEGIFFDGCSDVYIDNVHVSTFPVGIEVSNSFRVFINQCNLSGIQDFGLQINSNDNVSVRDTYIDCDDSASSRCIYAASCNQISVSGGTLRDAEWAVELENSSMVFDGYIESCTTGCFYLNDTAVSLTNSKCSLTVLNGTYATISSGQAGSAYYRGFGGFPYVNILSHYLNAAGTPPEYTFYTTAPAGPSLKVKIFREMSSSTAYLNGGASFSTGVNTFYIFENVDSLSSASLNLSSFYAGYDQSLGGFAIGTGNMSAGNRKLTIDDTSGDVSAAEGNLAITSLSKGLKIREGSNCRMGTSTLSAGSVVVSNTTITANTRIFLTNKSSANGLYVSARSAGVSFTVTGTGTDSFDWLLVEPTS